MAEDYEETIHILLDSNKVEDAIDIFGRMLKRGFRPSSEVSKTGHHRMADGAFSHASDPHPFHSL